MNMDHVVNVQKQRRHGRADGDKGNAHRRRRVSHHQQYHRRRREDAKEEEGRKRHRGENDETRRALLRERSAIASVRRDIEEEGGIVIDLGDIVQHDDSNREEEPRKIHVAEIPEELRILSRPNGRGQAATLPAWMSKRGGEKSKLSTGRGRAATLPAWMSKPDHQAPNDMPLSKGGEEAATLPPWIMNKHTEPRPQEFGPRPIIPPRQIPPPRGRGRGATIPAWMRNSERYSEQHNQSNKESDATTVASLIASLTPKLESIPTSPTVQSATNLSKLPLSQQAPLPISEVDRATEQARAAAEAIRARLMGIS